jgi:hypothetical protein
MTDNVNVDDLQSLFSQPTIISWNMAQEPVPPNWEVEFVSAYGCKSFILHCALFCYFLGDDKNAYPCTTNTLFVAVDKSNYMSSDVFSVTH